MFKPSAEFASIVLDRYTNGERSPFSDRVRMPKGFRTLGSGISRQGVLGPDGIVYKVGFIYDNDADVRRSSSLKRRYEVRGAEVLIPRAKRMAENGEWSVIAMEYMQKAKGYRTYCGCFNGYYPCRTRYQGECINRFYDAIGKTIGLSDMHHENVLRLAENTFAVIDLAM